MADELFKTLAEYSDESMSQYLTSRLRYTRDINVPPTVQFDLARSNMSQAELREVSAAFGRQDTSWGISDMINHITSREPDKIPVADLKAYQQNLIDRGFAPPNAIPTGVWDPEWNGASFMFEDANRRDQMGGNNWAASTVVSGLEVLTNTLPSKLWQGIVGGAKGLVEQAPETAERVGLLGGAASGAAIGTAIAPGVGTLVGAGAGALVGFLGDFLTHDDTHEDEDQAMFSAANFVDALSPWTEYQPEVGGLKALWEDVGFTLTAAGMAKGASLAIKGAASIGSSIGAAKAGIAEATGASPTATRALISIGEENTHIAGFISKYAKPISSVLRSDPFYMMRGVTTVAKPLVGGITAAGIAPRYFGGLGQESDVATREAIQAAQVAKGKPLTEDEINRIKQDVATQTGSTIEKTIQETEELGGPTVPVLGKVVDLPSLFLVPERVFPFKLGEMGAAINKGLKLGEQELMPVAAALQSHAAAQGEYISLRTAMDRGLTMLGRNPEERKINLFWMQMQAGFEAMTQRETKKIADVRRWETDHPEIDATKMSIKANLFEKFRSGELSADEVRSFVTGEERMNMASYLLENADSLERSHAFIDASRLSSRVTQDIRTGVLEVDEDVKGFLANSQQGINRASMQMDISALRSEAKVLRGQAALSREPEVIAQLQGQAEGLENQASVLIKELPSIKGAKRTTENLSITAALPDTMTSTDYITDATQYKLLKKEVIATEKAARGVEDALDPRRLNAANARQRLSEFVRVRAEEGKLPSRLVKEAEKPTPSNAVNKWMTEKAKYAGADARRFLDPETNAAFEKLGYKPVVTGSDLFQLDDVHQVYESMGGVGYSRMARILDTAGLSPLTHSDQSVVRFMQENQKAGLGAALDDAGVKANLDDAFGRLIKETHKEQARVRIGQVLLGKAPVVDVRQLNPEQIAAALADVGVDGKVAQDIFRKLKQPYGGEVVMHHPIESMHIIGNAIRANGLPGYADAIRSWKLPSMGQFNRLAYTGIGAGIGAGTQLFDPDHEYLKSALIGGAAGLGVAMAGFGLRNKGYGYLPDRLANLHNLLRFTLSPTFDAGRYVEQNSIAFAKHRLEPIFAPNRWVKNHTLKTPYTDAGATGDTLMGDATRFWERLTGGAITNADDLERRMSTAGVLGFVPQKFEALQALQLWNKHPGWSDERLLQEVLGIGRYGGGRSALEKSVNFLFFPFSYQKKLMTVAADFMLQEPSRRLLLHQLMRNYYLSGTSEKFHDFVEDHAPIMRNISRITNFGAYGLSPGRFFFQGFGEQGSLLGKATQALTSAFVPSGAAQPLAETFGKAGDWVMSHFAPITLTADQLRDQSIMDSVLSYLPVVRDMSAIFQDAQDQVTAITEGRSPQAQLDGYLMEKREFTNSMDPLAMAMGYTDFDGLRGSSAGAPYEAMYDAKIRELQDKYPSGYVMASSFDSTRDVLDEKALSDLVLEENPTPSQERIKELRGIEQSSELLSQMGMPSSMIQQVIGSQIRNTAMKYLNDSTFMGYYERFYQKKYGPIVVTR